MLEQTRSSIPAFEIVLGQANDMLCTLLGMPPREPGRRTGAVARAGRVRRCRTRRTGSRRESRPTCCGSGPTSAAPSARSPLRARRSASPRRSSIRASTSTARSATNRRTSPTLLESQSFMGSIVPNFRWNILNYGRMLNNVRLEQARTLELIASLSEHGAHGRPRNADGTPQLSQDRASKRTI